MKNFIVRAITGVFFVAAIVVSFLNPLAMVFLFALVTGMTIWEFCGLVNERPYVKDPINNWAYTMLPQLYIALPFSMLNVLAFPQAGSYSFVLPLSVFVFLWMNDTGAYLCGSLLGRHKLFPRVSPGKSWEGSIGGGLLVVGIAILVWYLLNTYVPEQANLNMWQWAGLGLTVVVFGTWGDLVESLLKRTLGIKDSGNILPGHGGMLDRFDSSLLAIPAAVVYLFTISLM